MKDKWIKKTVILLSWILIWQLVSLLVNNPVYFASPVETVRELFSQGATPVFWKSVGGSLLRILGGFFIASLAAFILAFLTYFIPFTEDIISPVTAFLKSVPVAAVVVILLIWWGASHLVLCISFMVVLPNIYENVRTGLKKTDPKLLEMAKVFGISIPARFFWIYRASYRPYLLSAVSVSLGMAFKSGIAAEIIGLPAGSIGDRLYRDKIYLNTAGVFAWIIVILIVSFITEKLVMFLLNILSGIPAACLKEYHGRNDKQEAAGGSDIRAEGLKKSFDDRLIIDNSLELKAGGVYYLNAPSGSGKTTLLNIIAGIEKADEGEISKGRISMVFQDDRLIMKANALRNLELAGCRGDLAAELRKVLPESVLNLPADRLSGGEKRRLAILRALLHPSDIVLMDEPFTGLDDMTKMRMNEYIEDHRNGRTLVIAGHDNEEETKGMEAVRLISEQ